MRYFEVFSALVAASALASAPASAQGERVAYAGDFPACDGYEAPGRTTDGISHGVSALSSFMMGGTESSQIRRSEPVYGPEGIPTCTVALNYRWMLPEYRLRRASLLEARGMHRLASGDAPGAIADFDLARESAGTGDPLTDRSFLLGLRLARAYAQLKAGDTAGAAREAQAVIAARPYDNRLAQMAAQLQFTAARDWPVYVRNLREISRIDPNLIAFLYTIAFSQGEFDEVIALRPNVLLNTPPAPTGNYQMPGRNAVLAETAVRQAVIDGIHAYALQTRGRNADADAALAAARAGLARAMAEPPLEPAHRGLTRSQRDQYAAMLARRPEAEAAIEEWARMVRLRRLVAEGNVAAVIADLESRRIAPDSAALDLFSAMARAQPALAADMSAMMDRLRHDIASQIDRALDLSVKDLAGRLPEPESMQRMPSYDSGGSPLDANGYSSLPGRIGLSTQIIRFASGRGSVSVANEMALLRAADLARRSGSHGLIVLRRGYVVRTTTIYGYGAGIMPSGQEVEIEVAFVDPATLPSAYADAGWRVLDPNVIWAALSPIYVRQGQAR